MKRRTFLKTLLGVLILIFSLFASAAEKIKVACVGDSITAGSGIKNPQMDSYPSVLSEMLGDSYNVANFGASGRTMLRRGDNPYWNDGKFRNAKDFKPDIIIIKLGTNDSKPQNWEFKDDFKRDLSDMISEFQRLESNPKILLCTPMFVAKTAWGIREEIVRDEIIPIIAETAKEKNLELIDLHGAFLEDAAMIPDGVHPNEAGAMKMASIISRAITGEEPRQLAEPRGKISEEFGFKRVNFPFQGMSISCMLPNAQNSAREWIWVVGSYSPSLSDAHMKALDSGKTIVWADAAIWWGSPSSMRWAFDFYTYMRAKFGLSGKAEVEADGFASLFALYWANDSTDKVAVVRLSSPICDISKFPDRNSDKQIDEFLKKWRITREQLDDPKTNVLNDLSKILNAGIKFEISGECDAETLKAAIKKSATVRNE